jgi:hypothetical protein
MSVEIFTRMAKFCEFPQNLRVYDDFPTSQQKDSTGRRAEGELATAYKLAVDRALKPQGEK